jgi:hypothetical protein
MDPGTRDQAGGMSGGSAATAQERAADVAHSATDTRTSSPAQVREQASLVAHGAIDHEKQVVERARGQLLEHGEQRAAEAGPALHRAR